MNPLHYKQSPYNKITPSSKRSQSNCSINQPLRSYIIHLVHPALPLILQQTGAGLKRSLLNIKDKFTASPSLKA